MSSTSSMPSLNPGRSEFLQIRRGGGLYIDKTHHFRSLLAPESEDAPTLRNPYVFLARPRRFGKSLLVTTLEAFFQGEVPVDPRYLNGHNPPPTQSKAELFRGTTAADAAESRGFHPVVRLNMANTPADSPEELKANLLEMLGGQYTLWNRRGINVGLEPVDESGAVTFPSVPAVSPAQRLEDLVGRLKARYGANPVVLVDEYDAPLVHLLGKDTDPEPILDVLRNFYVRLKSLESDLHFVFVTGITRFARVSLFSVLNNLRDISWEPAYATLCGFTEREARTALEPHLTTAAVHLDLSLKELMDQIRRHYNGYHFSLPGNSESVYNPFTLACCLRDLQDPNHAEWWKVTGWPNHWAISGNPMFLIRLMKEGQYPLPTDPPPWESLMSTTYSLDRVNFVSLMVQTGYYTLRQDTGGDLYLDYPNDEVRRTYNHELLETYRQPPDPRTLQAMHRALADEDHKGFCDLLHTFLAGVPSEKLRRETDCHLVLHVLCQLMQVEFQSEVHQGGGRSDMEIRFPEHVCVMEFKYGESPQTALDQIRTHGYGRRHFGGSRRVVALGLNFTPGTGTEPPAVEHAVCVRYRPG
ncbi:MAG: AAA family ATPase [Caldilineaceae bacterium SB0662_bin_9]|uniref:AAA family ATPase n=1 Tax=Caldilineaceae bacterium SB0662_bin_9 TaxID=2605258 RepID=A0A6B1DSI2_9CHLR|nr:AAA family ATPase [Caldilineaceae bacterium SB0662_bin_9]